MEMCVRCKVREVEQIDDWQSIQCSRCNDRDIERNENWREWHHYHPDEPCPSCELKKSR
jgi:hypothetical protein